MKEWASDWKEGEPGMDFGSKERRSVGAPTLFGEAKIGETAEKSFV
jgi:hypothetical protein